MKGVCFLCEHGAFYQCVYIVLQFACAVVLIVRRCEIPSPVFKMVPKQPVKLEGKILFWEPNTNGEKERVERFQCSRRVCRC